MVPGNLTLNCVISKIRSHAVVCWFVLGYEHVQGQVLDAKELKVLFEGLKLNNLHHFSHLLTGRIIITL